MRDLLCEVRKSCTNRPHQLATCHFKQRLTVTMWKFHDWDSYTWDKEELGQPDGILLALPPCLSQDTAVPRCSVPSQRWHSAPHTCPTLWHNSQSSSDISENSIPQDHPVTWELADSLVSPVMWGGLHLPSCPLPTVPSVQHRL